MFGPCLWFPRVLWGCPKNSMFCTYCKAFSAFHLPSPRAGCKSAAQRVRDKDSFHTGHGIDGPFFFLFFKLPCSLSLPPTRLHTQQLIGVTGITSHPPKAAPPSLSSWQPFYYVSALKEPGTPPLSPPKGSISFDGVQAVPSHASMHAQSTI